MISETDLSRIDVYRIAREAMPLGWAEGRMSQAPPVAWKQDVITTEIVKVGRYDDIQVQPGFGVQPDAR